MRKCRRIDGLNQYGTALSDNKLQIIAGINNTAVYCFAYFLDCFVASLLAMTESIQSEFGTFLQLIKIWHTEKTTAKAISGIFAKTMPLNRNMQDGITDSDIALSKSFLFQQTIQKIKYARHNAPFTDK